ncbi:MAG: hypothetical protein JOZ69_01340, partial [Myxococcales bacterium]|nr:hypothetical protein [Myxococcales bacterium]
MRWLAREFPTVSIDVVDAEVDDVDAEEADAARRSGVAPARRPANEIDLARWRDRRNDFGAF